MGIWAGSWMRGQIIVILHWVDGTRCSMPLRDELISRYVNHDDPPGISPCSNYFGIQESESRYSFGAAIFSFVRTILTEDSGKILFPQRKKRKRRNSTMNTWVHTRIAKYTLNRTSRAVSRRLMTVGSLPQQSVQTTTIA